MIRIFTGDVVKYLPSQVAIALVGLVSLPILTNSFSAAEYGRYTIVLSTIALISMMLGWLPMSIVRFYPEAERENRLGDFYYSTQKASLYSIGILMLLVGIMWWILPVTTRVLFQNYCLPGAVLFVANTLFELRASILRIQRRVTLLSIFWCINVIAGLALSILLSIVLHLGIVGFIWGQAIIVALMLPLIWNLTQPTDRRRVGEKNRFWVQVGKYWRYGVPLVSGNIAAWILSLSDRYIIQWYRGSAEVGIYSASYSVAEKTIFFLTTIFGLAAGPILIQAWESSGAAAAKEYLNKYARYYLILSLPLTVGLGILASQIVSIFTGTSYYYGAKIIPYIGVGAFFFGLYQCYVFSGPIFYKKTKPVMYALVLAGVVNILLNILLVPAYGYLGAALATLIAYIVLFILIVLFTRRIFSWRFPFSTLYRSVASTLVMAVLIVVGMSLIRLSSWLEVVLFASIGAVIYFVMLLITGEISHSEQQTLLRLFHLNTDDELHPINLSGLAKLINGKIIKIYHRIRFGWLKHARFPKIQFQNSKHAFFPFEGVGSGLASVHLGRAVNRIIHDADRICGHNYRLFGTQTIQLSENIDWHKDYVHNRTWPVKYYADLPVRYTDDSDIKYPWELSRFYQSIPLGIAFHLTRQERFADEFVAELISWNKKNPYYWGINWMVSLEVGLRAANLIWGWQLMRHSKAFTSEFKRTFYSLVYQHGKYLAENIEDWAPRTNHLIGDALGMIYTGVFFIDLPSGEGRRWLETGIKIFESAMHEQVYSDGGDYEASIPYHRFVLECFGIGATLARHNGYKLSKEFWNKLEKMFEFVRGYIRADGTAPTIGDDDSGRVHIFGGYYDWLPNDHEYLIGLAHRLFPTNPNFTINVVSDEEIWLFGLRQEAASNIYPIQPSSSMFPESGIYNLRGAGAICTMRCGAIGQLGYGGHAHNDSLSITLNVNGRGVLVDPGTYTYTGDRQYRDKFRSIAYHNTVIIDGIEQNVMVDYFRMKTLSNPSVLHWDVTQEQTKIEAKCEWAKRDESLTHRRLVIINNREHKLYIEDNVTCRAEQILAWGWHFHPDCEVDIIGNVCYIKSGNKKLNLRLPDVVNWKVVPYEYAPGYGKKVSASKLCGETINSKVVMPIKFTIAW